MKISRKNAWVIVFTLVCLAVGVGHCTSTWQDDTPPRPEVRDGR